jgi:type I restriction enzyme M protein
MPNHECNPSDSWDNPHKKSIVELETLDLQLIEMNREGNEENVKNIITVPLLEMLGWKKLQNMDFEHTVLRNKRADIALLLDKKNTMPDVIVETKKLYEPLNSHITQALLYAFDKGIELVVLTNGDELRVYKSFIPKTTESERMIVSIKRTELSTRFNELKKILGVDEFKAETKRIEQIGDQLISEEEFSYIVAESEKIMRNTSEMAKTGKPAFDEFNKILFIKLREDDRVLDNPDYMRKFTVKEIEVQGNPTEGEIKLEKDRNDYIQNQFTSLMGEYKDKGFQIFDVNHRIIELKSGVVRHILALLEPYNIRKSSVAAKAKVYEQFIDEIFRGKEGQYFTPRTIVGFMVDLIGVQYGSEGIKILDPACGSGGFLVTAYDRMKEDLDHKYKKVNANGELMEEFKNEDSKKEYDDAMDHLKSIIIGIDKDGDLAATTRMNMIMHGDGSVNVYYANALDKENERTKKVISKENPVDIILTNPPMGLKIGVKNKKTKKVSEEDSRVLRQYEISKLKWNKKTQSLESAKVRMQDSQALFLERCLDLLKEGGYLCTVIDDGILSNSSDRYVREYIKRAAIVKAVISLPEKTFKSKKTGVKTSIIVLQKKRRGSVQDKVFMASANHVGIDATGRTKGVPNELGNKYNRQDTIIDDYCKWRSGEFSR